MSRSPLPLLVLTLACAAPAQNAPPAQSDPAQSLRGPSVSPTASAGTLVERDFDGRLKPLDIRPEEAALALLDLSPAERQATTDLLTRRFAKVSDLVRDHQGLFLNIQSARQSGDLSAMPELLRELRPLAADLIEPPLADQLARDLTPANAAELRRLVSEYSAAFAAENPRKDANADRPTRRPPPPGITEINLLIREMARALAQTVAERRERTDHILAVAQATPEQEARIRALVREFGERNAGKADADRRDLLRAILETLTPEQRRRVVEDLRK